MRGMRSSAVERWARDHSWLYACLTSAWAVSGVVLAIYLTGGWWWPRPPTWFWLLFTGWSALTVPLALSLRSHGVIVSFGLISPIAVGVAGHALLPRFGIGPRCPTDAFYAGWFDAVHDQFNAALLRMKDWHDDRGGQDAWILAPCPLQVCCDVNRLSERGVIVENLRLESTHHDWRAAAVLFVVFDHPTWDGRPFRGVVHAPGGLEDARAAVTARIGIDGAAVRVEELRNAWYFVGGRDAP